MCTSSFLLTRYARGVSHIARYTPRYCHFVTPSQSVARATQLHVLHKNTQEPLDKLPYICYTGTGWRGGGGGRYRWECEGLVQLIYTSPLKKNVCSLFKLLMFLDLFCLWHSLQLLLNPSLDVLRAEKNSTGNSFLHMLQILVPFITGSVLGMCSLHSLRFARKHGLHQLCNPSNDRLSGWKLITGCSTSQREHTLYPDSLGSCTIDLVPVIVNVGS